MNYMLHWKFFLALDESLYTISRYIEINEDNFNAYSTELTRCYLSSCAEFDVVCRSLCSKLDPNCHFDDYNRRYEKGDKPPSMKNCAEIILKKWPEISKAYTIEVNTKISIFPFSTWTFDNIGKDVIIQSWWQEHNMVKHFRNEHYKYANLKNTIYSMSALMLIILYFIKQSGGKSFANLISDVKSFNSNYFPRLLCCGPEEDLPST
jgi:hypothetical protein